MYIASIYVFSYVFSSPPSRGRYVFLANGPNDLRAQFACLLNTYVDFKHSVFIEAGHAERVNADFDKP